MGKRFWRWVCCVIRRYLVTCGTVATPATIIGISLVLYGHRTTATGVAVVLALWCAIGATMMTYFLGIRYWKKPSDLLKDIRGSEPDGAWARMLIVSLASVIAMIVCMPFMMMVDKISTRHRRRRILAEEARQRHRDGSGH